MVRESGCFLLWVLEQQSGFGRQLALMRIAMVERSVWGGHEQVVKHVDFRLCAGLYLSAYVWRAFWSA